MTKTTAQVLSIAVASLLSTGAAFAQEATPDTWLTAAHSSKSRADVARELTEARKTGLTQAWSAGYIEPVRSHALRAEIKAQTMQAIASGELKAINDVVYSYQPVAPRTLAAK